jgi:hypothetical protein
MAKTEPQLEALPAPPAVAAEVAAMATPPAAGGERLDLLSRVEDKTARIEEKFARSEERMMRVESALEKATIRLEGASQDMNLNGLKEDVARLREDVRRKPGAATIFVVAILAALIGAGLSFALMKFGIPGVLPGVGR